MHPTSFSSHDFIQLALDNKVLKFGEFILKSGRISPYFFNAGLLATGEMLSLLARGYAEALAEQMTANNNDADSASNKELVIFGAAYKGIPFVAATAQTHCGYIMVSMPNGVITAKKSKSTVRAVI